MLERWSPLTQGRGLKLLQTSRTTARAVESPLTQGRGLKRLRSPHMALNRICQSPLTQGRGLKQLVC